MTDCAKGKSSTSYATEDAPLRQNSSSAGTASATVFVENPPTNERFIYDHDGTVYGKILSTAPVDFIPPTMECWFCHRAGGTNGNGTADELFCPCNCYKPMHRECFRRWRSGWMNPRNYFGCPTCGHSYNMQEVRSPSDVTRERVERAYRIAVLKMWLLVIFGFGGLSMLVGGIGYGADTSEKNVPVFVKCLLTSVISGFPNSNSTTEWRESFKQPDVPVWPYYALLGILVTSIVVLIAFLFSGCSFDENDRRRQGHCRCCDDCCSHDSGFVWMCYDPCPTTHFHHHHDSNCCDCAVGSSGCHGSCGDCNTSSSGDCGGGGGGDIGAAIAIVILVIVALIIFSAIFVIVIAMVQRCSLLYDRMTDMIRNQQLELVEDVVVLGMYETWRPNQALATMEMA